MLLNGDPFSGTQAFLQVVIALVGILTQLMLIIKSLLKDAPEKKDQATVDESVSDKGTIERKRSIIDLSFVLICAALFSLLLTDSLLISGKSPSPRVDTILYVFCLTAAVTGTLVGAWHLNKGELVAGCLAITTLIVLIISPGGPFFSSSKGSEEGLSLWVPVVALVILASISILYSFGNPFTRSLSKTRRLLVSSVLIAIIVIAAVALGKHNINAIKADARTPKLDHPDVRELLSKITNEEVDTQRDFYRFASEVVSSGTYKQHHRTVEGERGSLRQNIETQGSIQQSSGIDATNTNTTAKGLAEKKPSPQDKSLPSSSKTPSQSEDDDEDNKGVEDQQRTEREALNVMVRAADRLGDTSAKAVLNSMESRLGGVIYTAEEQRQQEGNNTIRFLINHFKALDNDQQLSYLEQRLLWIHPAGLPSESQANVSLPGTTINSRFEILSYYRTGQALNDGEKRRIKLRSQFDYPSIVRAGFKEPSGDSQNILNARLFPKADPLPMTMRLMDQMTLPQKEEAYTSYEEYNLMALSLVKDRFQAKVDVKSIATTFNQLDSTAQDAFLLYAVNNKTEPQAVYQMLLDFKANHINFVPLSESKDSLVVEKLRSMVEGKDIPNEDVELVGLARAIRNMPSKSCRDTFINLLKSENTSTPIKRLFQSGVFDLVAQIDANLGNERKEFLEYIADPIWSVIKHIAETEKIKPDSKVNLLPLLEQFRSLQGADQEGLLLYLAISLYQPGGDYSLSPVDLLIAQAELINPTAGLLSAATIIIPLLLIAVWGGSFVARKLVGRDRLREVVLKETIEYPNDGTAFGTPVDLLGREDILRNLRNLAEKGWSTIGVVGRRGIGKSRLLYGLAQSKDGEADKPSIKVWVSSPSKFQEDEFVCSMFERLALSTEAAIANNLGVRPISIRRLENRIAQVGAWAYAGAVLVLTLIIYNMVTRLSRVDIVITWIPIIALILVSMGLFINYVLKLQPVDLTLWLQRDRTNNPHTVMLYREVIEALHRLRYRSHSISITSGSGIRLSKLVWLILLGVIGIFSSYVVVSNILSGPPLSGSFIQFAILALTSLVGLVFLSRQWSRNLEGGSAFGQSLMSLIADYRNFACTVVYRLKQGALTSIPAHKFFVMICIDELDKIVDFDDIRTFVRRIKAIFEVPGVYYYVSLAEDTLTALYLGPAEGKNEIDSSFDHIVRIPPISCAIGEEIAKRYLESHGYPNPAKRLARTISTLSFGIPRDILRRCDEFMARTDSSSLTPQQIVSEVRQTQGMMGYELQYLSKKEINSLAECSPTSAQNILELLNSTTPNHPASRLLLSLWLIFLIELAVSIEEEAVWENISNELCNTGYKLPVDNLYDLKQEIVMLHEKVVTSITNVSPVVVSQK